MRQQRAFCIFLILLALPLVVYYSAYLADNASFYIYDLYAGWQPFLSYMGSRLRAGQLPLWNPYAMSGMSQISVIAPTVFHPLYLLFAPLRFNPAFALVLIIQQVLSGAALFALVGSFGWGLLPAAFAGFAIALSGLMFSLQPTPTLMGTVAWLLIDWWAIRRIARPTAAGKLAATALASLCTYMLITAGVVEIFAPGLVFLGLIGLRDLQRSKKHLRRQAFWLLALRWLALGTGVLMSCNILLPAAEWSRISPRTLGLPLNELFAWSCNWYDFLCTIVPQPLGDLYQPWNPFRGYVATAPNQTPYLSNTFVGPVVLTLALWGACDGRWRQRWLVLAALLVAIIIAAGSNAPPVVALVKALHFRVFRYPIKAMVFVVLLLVLMAARGIHLYLRERSMSFSYLSWFFWLAFGASAIVTLLAAGQPGFAAQYHLDAIGLQIAQRCAKAAAITSLVGLLCCASTLVPLRTNQAPPPADAEGRPIEPRVLGAIALCAAVVGTLCYDAWAFNRHEGPADLYRKPGFVAQKLRQLSEPEGSLYRVAVVYETPHAPATAVPPSRHEMQDVYTYSYQMLSPSTNISQRFDNVDVFMLGQTADNKILWQTAMDEYRHNGNDVPLATMCRMASAPFMCCELGAVNSETRRMEKLFAPPDARFFKSSYINQDLNLGIYSIRQPMPRAYFATAPRWGKPHVAVRDFVARSDKTGFDPSHLTILEHINEGEVGPEISVSPYDLLDSQVAFETDLPEYIRLRASTPKDNFLVLTDQFYPGWHATVDGKRATIYPANVIFRAVLVPKGDHTVEFRYAPASLRWGLILHLLGWVVVIKLLVLAWLSRQRPAV